MGSYGYVICECQRYKLRNPRQTSSQNISKIRWTHPHPPCLSACNLGPEKSASCFVTTPATNYMFVMFLAAISMQGGVPYLAKLLHNQSTNWISFKACNVYIYIYHSNTMLNHLDGYLSKACTPSFTPKMADK